MTATRVLERTYGWACEECDQSDGGYENREEREESLARHNAAYHPLKAIQ